MGTAIEDDTIDSIDQEAESESLLFLDENELFQSDGSITEAITKESPDSGKYIVLIVDDHITNYHVLHGILERADISTEYACNALLAMDRLQKEPLPDMILLDIMMPGENGLSFCSRLKRDRRYRNIPILIVSSLNDDIYKARGFAVGATDYIFKPFSMIEVLARVKVHLTLNDRIYELKKVRSQSDKLVDCIMDYMGSNVDNAVLSCVQGLVDAIAASIDFDKDVFSALETAEIIKVKGEMDLNTISTPVHRSGINEEDF